jgi:hypothetical protein
LNALPKPPDDNYMKASDVTKAKSSATSHYPALNIKISRRYTAKQLIINYKYQTEET